MIIVNISIIFTFTDMCPKPNDTQTELSKSSHVEELTDGVPGLFAALTSEPDPQQRWLSITYPVDIDLSAYRPGNPEKQVVYHLRKLPYILNLNFHKNIKYVVSTGLLFKNNYECFKTY